MGQEHHIAGPGQCQMQKLKLSEGATSKSVDHPEWGGEVCAVGGNAAGEAGGELIGGGWSLSKIEGI